MKGFEMRHMGIVKWFDDGKGYGFITPDAGGNDVFVHYTGINGRGHRTLEPDAAVEYEIEEGDRGPMAVDVTVCAPAAT
jgi:CspA family cold shock protein